MDNQHVNKTLEELIEVNKEGIKIYRDASDKMEEYPDLKTILYRLSQQRALFEAELKDDMRDMGGDPDNIQDDLQNSLKDIWQSFKSGLHGSDVEKVIDDLKTSESSAMRTYESAIADELPEYIKDTVEQQYKLIRGAYDQLVEFQQNPS